MQVNDDGFRDDARSKTFVCHPDRGPDRAGEVSDGSQLTSLGLAVSTGSRSNLQCLLSPSLPPALREPRIVREESF